MVVFFQVLREMIDRAALAGAMSNQNDLIRRQQVLCNLFVKCFLFGNPLALVVGFFLVNEVVVKTERIVGTDCLFCLRDFLVKVLVNMRGVMIDHHDHPNGLRRFDRRRSWTGIPEELS